LRGDRLRRGAVEDGEERHGDEGGHCAVDHAPAFFAARLQLVEMRRRFGQPPTPMQQRVGEPTVVIKIGRMPEADQDIEHAGTERQ